MPIQEYIDGLAFGYGATSNAIPESDYHCKNDYEIMYVKKGSRKVFLKDVSYNLTAGNILFIDKNLLHKTSSLTDDYERYVINFTDEYILPTVKKEMSSLFSQRIFAPSNTSDIDKYFFDIFSAWNQLRKGNLLAKDSIKCNINLLLINFIDHSEEYMYNAAKINNPTIERLVKYMNKNFNLSITLSDCAKMLHISSSHLSRIFFKYTGFGFLEYLKILRIENSKKLLVNTKMSIKDIAIECGFNDSNYFSSSFKRYTGISPLKYREKGCNLI